MRVPEKVHSFADKLGEGKAYEAALDGFFGASYRIRRASAGEDRRGIDRYFTPPDGREFAVQYKGDRRAAETGNCFIETVSVDVEGIEGCALTSEAEVQVIYLPEPARLLWVPTENLRADLPYWRRFFPTKAAANRGYNTLGLCVPVWAVAQIASHIYEVVLQELPAAVPVAVWRCARCAPDGRRTGAEICRRCLDYDLDEITGIVPDESEINWDAWQ